MYIRNIEWFNRFFIIKVKCSLILVFYLSQMEDRASLHEANKIPELYSLPGFAM